MRELKFEYDSTEYTISFDRKAFVSAENQGFDINKATDQPLKAATLLFVFGLQKNHHTLQLNKIDKILDEFLRIFDTGEFLAFCFEEYSSFFMTTQPDSKEKQKLNIQTK